MLHCTQGQGHVTASVFIQFFFTHIEWFRSRTILSRLLGHPDAAYIYTSACDHFFADSMSHPVNGKLLQSYRRCNFCQNQPLHKDCRKLRVSCATAGPPGTTGQFVRNFKDCLSHFRRSHCRQNGLQLQARMPCLRKSVPVGHSYRLGQLFWVGICSVISCNERSYCHHASLVLAATLLHARSASSPICMMHAGMHLMLQASPAQAVGFKKVCSS